MRISPQDYDAVLFDMDGVLTQTASMHAETWKRTFDAFLQRHSASSGQPIVPFDSDADYHQYVDGMPRYDGVANFLKSRGIDLPLGRPDDSPDTQSVYGLGNHKEQLFLEALQLQGAATFESAFELLRALRAHDIRTVVVTSSTHCGVILQAAGMTDLFDARVDGNDLARLQLPGKPSPAAMIEGGRRVHVEPPRAIVIEDAVAGIQAGRAGSFGLVIGVDHVGQSKALREAGADVVIRSLAQIQIAEEPASAWSLVYESFDPARERIREALCALGNGYFETRGALPWSSAGAIHYPGTYIAGGYNRLRTAIDGRIVANEDLVNFPNWLSLTFAIEDAGWFELGATSILSYRQELDLRRGVLLRTMRVEDEHGRRTMLRERRFVSMANMHVCALELMLVAENWSGKVAVRSGIDGRIVNAGAKGYEPFDNRHLQPLASENVGEDSVLLLVRTNQSDIRVAQAARTQAYRDGERIESARRHIEEPGYVAQEFEVDLASGQTLVLEKFAVLFTSRDRGISECTVAARKAIERAQRFSTAMGAHVRAWKHLWRRFDIRMEPADPRGFPLNVPMLLRLNMLHVLQAVSFNSMGLDIGVPARAWTGEAYQGHVFWDELFVFPFLNYRAPEVTRSLLIYRYRRLDEARFAAAAAGYRGAMFPWQSGSDGQEETPELGFDPRRHLWIPDNSFRQRHVGSAIAFNVWQYFQVTSDMEFLQFYGAELILEIARFWSSVATFNPARQRYEIHRVVGPDEYHVRYPDSTSIGVDNNAYTNVMATWVLWRALDVLDLLPDIRRLELLQTLEISNAEIQRWNDISRRMFVPFRDDGVISQFEGYEQLLELDWKRYRAKYGDLQRIDVILEAEHDDVNRYKVAKQADVLMLFYVFSADELAALFRRLEYPFDTASIPVTIDYYVGRASHGSTLSRVVHAWVLARSDRPRGMAYFAEALQSDVSDIQKGTTAEGVHLGAMAGTIDLIQRVSTALEATGDILRLNPELPPELASLDMHIRYRGHSLDLRLTRDRLTVRGGETAFPPIRLAYKEQLCELASGTTKEFTLK